MSLLPRWFNRLPSPMRGWKGSELGKFFSNADEGFDWLATRSSGLSIYYDDDNVTIEADVPGLSAKEVDVSVDSDGLLWIKGERSIEEKSKDKNCVVRSQQSYSYCIPLGEDVDFSKEPKASCKDGVMQIVFSKKREKQKESKKITVREKD